MPFFQPTIPPLPEGTSLVGQTALVTGATAGIGHELSLQLLRLGLDSLILGVRSLPKGAATRLALLADKQVQAVNPGARVTVFELDLARYDTVVDFANRVLSTTPRLDALILNAGINLAHFETSTDGNELCMQVNVLSNAFLSLLLLPVLQSTAASHYGGSSSHPTITWVGSLAQVFHSLVPCSPPVSDDAAILPYYASPAHYSSLRRYADTKLFVAMFVREMAARLRSRNSANAKTATVVINNVCPGTVRTGADNNLPFWLRIPMNANRALRARSVEDGARTVLWAVVGGLHRGNGDDAEELNGFYIADNRVQEPAPFANTPDGMKFAKRLWDEIVAEGQKIDVRVGSGLGP